MQTELNTLLNATVKIIQFKTGIKASSDAVLLSSVIDENLDKSINNVLDVGIGGGAISLCLSKRFPNFNIVGIDIQDKLLDLAKESIKINNFNNIDLIYEDILNPSNKIKDILFDLVITNPPYYKGTQSPDNIKAIAHNENNIDLNKWITNSIKRLKVQGIFAIIHKAERIDDIIHSLKQNNMGKIEIFLISSKVDQNPKRVIIKAKKHSKSESIVYKPIIIHNEDGSYTKIAEDILENGKSLISMI